MRVSPSDGVVVVTGAGSGLGRALARVITREGFTVVGLGRRLGALQETGVGLAGFVPMVVDVADWASVSACFAEVRAAHGPVAVLVNNAAVYSHRDILEETGESFAQTVGVNLGGVVNCTRAALDDMVAAGRGRVLNVATFADIAPLPTASAYSVSKGAARVFTRALLADLGDRFPGIVVSDWMPGMLATGMGIADGLAPEVAAEWGARLALSRDVSLSGSVFEMDREVLPEPGLKGRLKDLILLRRRRARGVAEL